MKKYNEEYFSVINKNTGKKIVDCAEYADATLMFEIDPNNRQIIRNKFVMGQVIDIEMPKALPTNEVVVVGSDYNTPIPTGNGPRQLPQIKLREGQQEPFIV